MALTLFSLNLQEADQIYQTCMQQDFLPQEIKPLSMIHAAIAAGKYLCVEARDPQAGLDSPLSHAAYAFLAMGSNGFWMLDYFAVNAAARGTGIGSAVLSLLPQLLMQNGGRCLILEVENPAVLTQESDREHARRRIRFYERCGVRHTGLASVVCGVGYLLLTLRDTNSDFVDDEHVLTAMKQIYSDLFGQEFYESQVTFRQRTAQELG